MFAASRSALCLPNWASQALKSGQGKRNTTGNARSINPRKTTRPFHSQMKSSTASLAGSMEVAQLIW